ncbi:ubiquitin-conjugating enzyme E2 U isoform X8 [Canis aureus]
MHCRAYFLLERDFQELKENDFKGITAFPVSEDLMEWGANIEGLQNTFWHGLFFELTINFTSQYNFVPPVVKFITIPFHPNVDQNTGRVCIDFLDDPEKWNTNYTLSSILLALQVMLSNPVLENPVNLEAARMLIKDESLYKQIVLRLFSQPIQLRENSLEFPKDPHKLTRYAAAVAGLARESRRLSKANYPTERNQLCPTPISVRPESRYGVAGSSAWHPISYDQVEIFADTQTEMDSVMKTGRTKERWKSVALPDGGNESESWEEEVEDLVTWTNTLNTNILED